MTKMIFAHRGSSGTHPENTLAAITDAIAVGVDGIEIDVQKTKDGKLVVIHDETVDRTTNGSGEVIQMTLEEIQALDAGSWFSNKFQGERIPTLDQVLDLVKDTSVQLNIELKNDLVDYPNLEEDVVRLVKKYEVMDQVLISSFNYQSLARFSSMNTPIELAVLTELPLPKPDEFLRNHAASCIHCSLEAYEEMMNSKEGEQLNYRVFTLNSDDELMRWAHSLSCDLFTDYPEKASTILNKKNSTL